MLDPDDHPASMTPYTAIDDIMSTSRMPHGASTNCSLVVWWAMEKVAPNGTTEKAIKAGMSDRYGARA